MVLVMGDGSVSVVMGLLSVIHTRVLGQDNDKLTSSMNLAASPRGSIRSENLDFKWYRYCIYIVCIILLCITSILPVQRGDIAPSLTYFRVSVVFLSVDSCTAREYVLVGP